VEAFKKVLPRGQGLEIGVGTGRFASALGIGTGIDPSGNMLKMARGRGLNVRPGVGEKLPFAPGTFDYAAIIITLCFVKEPQKVLCEAARVLKRNGTVAVGIVDKNSFLGKFYRTKKSVFYKQAKFLGVRDVADFLKRAGFQSLSYYQTLFDFPEKMVAVAKPRRGFGRGGFVVIAARKAS